MSAGCPSCVAFVPTHGYMVVRLLREISSAMRRKILLIACSFAACSRPASTAFVVMTSDPKTMAPIMPSKAMATKTSTSVKPASDLKSEPSGEDIRADLYRFLQSAAQPGDLDPNLTNQLQRGRSDRPFPFVSDCSRGDLHGHLRSQRNTEKLTGAFPNGILS